LFAISSRAGKEIAWPRKKDNRSHMPWFYTIWKNNVRYGSFDGIDVKASATWCTQPRIFHWCLIRLLIEIYCPCLSFSNAEAYFIGI
jgi:hypothetical protein